MKSPAKGPGRTLRKWSLRILRVLGVVYVLALLGCAAIQRRLIYFPQVLPAQQVDEYAQAAGLERWSAPSGQFIGWKRLSPTQPANGRVLILHGNGGCAFPCAHYSEGIPQAAPPDV